MRFLMRVLSPLLDRITAVRGSGPPNQHWLVGSHWSALRPDPDSAGFVAAAKRPRPDPRRAERAQKHC